MSRHDGLLRCACGGTTLVERSTARQAEHAVERIRRCEVCGDLFVTFEVVAGTAITWQLEDAPA